MNTSIQSAPSLSPQATGQGLVRIAVLVSTLFFTSPVFATESSAPWECSGYSGPAHTRCLQAYIEVQQEKISELESELAVQRGTVGQLKEQIDRQASTTADLQRQLSERPAVLQSQAYPYYTYPPVGFSFYLGRPWLYGPRFFPRPYYWGLGHFGFHYYYGHRRHRW